MGQDIVMCSLSPFYLYISAVVYDIILQRTGAEYSCSPLQFTQTALNRYSPQQIYKITSNCRLLLPNSLLNASKGGLALFGTCCGLKRDVRVLCALNK